MFSDCDYSSSGFPSNWNALRTRDETSIQTTDVGTEEKYVQTNKPSYHVKIQTEQDRLTTAAIYDEAQLGAFLSRVCPAVVKELDLVSCSNAFRLDGSVAESIQDVREMMRLPAAEEALRVTALSWSCTGSVLAVALSHFQHTSWCDHQSYISLYNVDREYKNLICTLDAPSCVRSVTMHPFLASLVAAGTYSGEVLLWDTAVEGSDTALIGDRLASHGDVVTEVRWIIGLGNAVTLVSCSLDGQLIFWKVSPKLSSYQIIARYKCGTEAGITCFGFPPHIVDMFVAALEGGVIVLCSTTTDKSTGPGSARSNLVKNPVMSRFEPHPATISALEFSPHHNDLFATVATDQAIRIFSLYQKCAQRVIWGNGPMLGLGWNPLQANIIAAWGHSAQVAIFNSTTGHSLKALSPSNLDTNILISAVSFNFKSPRLLAIGGLDGITRVWKIPYHLHT